MEVVRPWCVEIAAKGTETNTYMLEENCIFTQSMPCISTASLVSLAGVASCCHMYYKLRGSMTLTSQLSSARDVRYISIDRYENVLS